ncbi:M14 family metallopeptidase [Rhodoferax sp.]|uniref:M14 family metallopeptidase n=1 Tax=Rhodoferax sp. TaxID=50421 RepID=UPI00374DCE35
MDLDSFSQNYASAREKFLRACEQRGLAVEDHPLALPGRYDEALALDVARSGPADAPHLLVVSSGCHGIEGYCGSAVQVDLLRDDNWQQQFQRDGLAVLYLHALNPHGFSWGRRVTQENVDLNRNFRDFSLPRDGNPGYQQLAPLLLPRRCPPTLGSELGLLLQVLRKGKKRLQTAISSGQQHDPTGMFFAGHGPTWSNLALRQILRTHAQQCRHIAWIDVHTGLGPMGVGERIYKGRPDAASLARARRWWGAQVTSSADGSSTSSVLGGTMDECVLTECPQAEYNGLTLEFGTLPSRQVLDALRADHWLYRNPQTDAQRTDAIRQRLRQAFYVETDDWKRQVLAQSREVMRQSLAGLSAAAADLPLGA